jgi:hypothetical protein
MGIRQERILNLDRGETVDTILAYEVINPG